jgi:hypothetical protein
MKTPPSEIRQISECLVRLRGISEPNISQASNRKKPNLSRDVIWNNIRVGYASWNKVKVELNRSSFRTWLAELPRNIECVITHEAVNEGRKLVEDMNITYDRMRAVSIPGYHALIVVAACIQYMENLQHINSACQNLSTILNSKSNFSNLLISVRT